MAQMSKMSVLWLYLFVVSLLLVLVVYNLWNWVVVDRTEVSLSADFFVLVPTKGVIVD